ncbi:hypothetical protein BHYA_0013g00460 [Botrytis hyacinthi]|uniref:Uncharacterized protein n=1 Tax=Botrytis hyacinthi TaxID=278943 RepID=A0A4Z1GZU2_9HELO|nr:hypothetical protein BHYA_0013g00460 [Botrytis hyacinthi]
MFDGAKSPKDKYQSERTIRVDTMPPPYRSTYVVEPTLVPVNSYRESMYYAQERERDGGRERERVLDFERERERDRERGRRPSCSDLFHNIDVIQRLGERFKGLNTTFSPPPPSVSHSNSSAASHTSSSAVNGNTHARTQTRTQTQTNESFANTAILAARIKELEREKELAREKEIEKLSGGLNGVRGDIKGLQMKSEREEGRREGRMEGMGIKILSTGNIPPFGETWLSTNGEINPSLPSRGQDREVETSRRRNETEQQNTRGRVDEEVIFRRIDDKFAEGKIDRLADAERQFGERQREMVAAMGRGRDNESAVRMNRFEDRFEGRVERVEDRVERIVEREMGRGRIFGEGVRDRDRERDRERRDGSEIGRERHARPRIMRERERERDWEYGYENRVGSGGLRYRGYV